METKPKPNKKLMQIAQIATLVEKNRVLEIAIFMKLAEVVAVNTQMSKHSRDLTYATPEDKTNPSTYE
jgi:hypothetical protein